MDRAPIGLFGLGLMGTAITRRLLAAHLAVMGFDVDASKREGFAALGGLPAESAASVAASCPTVVLAVFDTSQVESVVEGPPGLFGTAVLTLLPATLFSGLIDPVSSLEGGGALIGRIYPATHFLTITRGTFSKALGFADLYGSFIPLLIAIPVLLGLSAALLKKQET